MAPAIGRWAVIGRAAIALAALAALGAAPVPPPANQALARDILTQLVEPM